MHLYEKKYFSVYYLSEQIFLNPIFVAKKPK